MPLPAYWAPLPIVLSACWFVESRLSFPTAALFAEVSDGGIGQPAEWTPERAHLFGFFKGHG